MQISEAYRIDTNVAYRRLNDDVFAITPDSRFHTIDNAVGKFIWVRLEQGPSTVADLVAAVTERFMVDQERATLDIAAFLESLVENGLVVKCDAEGNAE